jgi:hypothetical protein
LNVDLALSIAPQFRFDMTQAKDQLAIINKTVSHWREMALKQKLSRMEIETMAPAFR